MSTTVLFQIIQFSISAQLSSIWLIDRTLSGDTTPSWCGPGSVGSEGVLCIPPNSSITGTSTSGCLVSYPGHSLWVLPPPPREAVSIFHSFSRLGNLIWVLTFFKITLYRDSNKCNQFKIKRILKTKSFYYFSSLISVKKKKKKKKKRKELSPQKKASGRMQLLEKKSLNFETAPLVWYLSLPPTRQDLTQGQKPEGRLKWG